LAVGTTITLLDSGGNPLALTADGSFTFAGAVLSGTSYAVTVGTPPAGQSCPVTGGSNTVAGASVTNILVDCAALTYNVSAIVSGLTSSTTGLVLTDNGSDNLAVNTNGTINFNTPIASGGAFAVAILTQPAGGTCAVVQPSSGTVTGPVSVSVSCTVNPAQLVSILVTPPTASIAVGATQQYTATGTYSDSSMQNVTAQVTWGSSNTGVATITAAGASGGLATGVAAGNITVTASITANGTTLTSTVPLIVTGSSMPSSACPSPPYANPTYCGTLTAISDVGGSYTGTFYFSLSNSGMGSGGTLITCSVSFTSTTYSPTLPCTGTWFNSANIGVSFQTGTPNVAFSGMMAGATNNTVTGTVNSGEFGPGGGLLSGNFTGTLQ
jgi:hypothetical protein